MILTGWKEISNHLRYGVRTVQRWHEEWQLPVHQIHPGSRRSPVFAYQDELDRWMHRHARDSMIAESDRQLASIKGNRDKVSKFCQRLTSFGAAGQQLRKKLNDELEQARQNRLTFMCTDLDAGLTMAKIAERALDERKRERNEKNAHRALDTVLHLYRESRLTDDERKCFDEKITELKTAPTRLLAKRVNARGRSWRKIAITLKSRPEGQNVVIAWSIKGECQGK